MSDDVHLTLDAHNLALRYTDLVALDIPALRVTGRVIAVLGHNGAGKSTLIKALLGLLSPAAGSLAVRRADGAALIPADHMAFCPETGAVFSDVTVERYLQLWCRIKQNDARYYRREGSRYVERLSIAELLAKRGRELSKGQRRRVQTAIGFMGNPRLFLFDEPFDGLDVQRTTDLMEIVEEERAARAFLISSHRMDVMERLADVVVVLQHGRVAAAGTPEQVCQQLCPAGPASAAAGNLTDAMRFHLQALRQAAFVR
jgi:ABC-type multidrug transport system ATPase subunit